MKGDRAADSRFDHSLEEGVEVSDHHMIYQGVAEILNEAPDSLTAPRIGPLIDEQSHLRLTISQAESIALVDSAAILSFILEKNKLSRHGPSVTKPGFFARLLEQKVAANHFEGWPNNSKNIMATSIVGKEEEGSLNNTKLGKTYNTMVASSFEAAVLGPKQGALLKKNSVELERIEKKLDELVKLVGGARAGAMVAGAMAEDEADGAEPEQDLKPGQDVLLVDRQGAETADAGVSASHAQGRSAKDSKGSKGGGGGKDGGKGGGKKPAPPPLFFPEAAARASGDANYGMAAGWENGPGEYNEGMGSGVMGVPDGYGEGKPTARRTGESGRGKKGKGPGRRSSSSDG